MAKKRRKNIGLTDPCPVCGAAMVIPKHMTKIEAERLFRSKHTKERCDYFIATSKFYEELESKPCAICGQLGGGLRCDCNLEKE